LTEELPSDGQFGPIWRPDISSIELGTSFGCTNRPRVNRPSNILDSAAMRQGVRESFWLRQRLHTRVSQLEGGRGFVDEPPTNSKFLKTHVVHAVGHRPHTALACLPGTFVHPHRMDDRGSVKRLWATTGVSTHTGKRTAHANCPLWPVVVSSCCLRLASAPPWERLPEISKSRNLESQPACGLTPDARRICSVFCP
jgi:hypothetical protein